MGVAIVIPNADFEAISLGQVTFKNVPGVLSVEILGDSSVTNRYQFSAKCLPESSITTGKGFIWSIVSGGQYATIDEQGVLTALSGAEDSEVTIQATSKYNTEISETKTISVTYTGYIGLNGLRSVSDCAVDLGITPNENYKYEAELEFIDSESKFGCRTDNANKFMIILKDGHDTTDKKSLLRFPAQKDIVIYPNTKYKIAITKSYYEIDGTRNNFSFGGATFNKNIFLFGVNDINGIDYGSQGLKIYSFKVYDGQSNLINHFVPVWDMANSQYAFYDKTNDTPITPESGSVFSEE